MYVSGSWQRSLASLGLSLPDRLKVSDCTITSDMAPRCWEILILRIYIVPKQFTQLQAGLDLRYCGKRARFDSNVVRIVYHGHKVPEERRNAHISGHVGLVSWGPDRQRMLAQQPCGSSDGILDSLGTLLKYFGVLYRFRDKFLRKARTTLALCLKGKTSTRLA
jgi:hypothetical protein